MKFKKDIPRNDVFCSKRLKGLNSTFNLIIQLPSKQSRKLRISKVHMHLLHRENHCEFFKYYDCGRFKPKLLQPSPISNLPFKKQICSKSSSTNIFLPNSAEQQVGYLK